MASRYDRAGDAVRALVTGGRTEALARLQGITGIPTSQIERTVAAAGLDLETVTPDEFYRAHTKLRLGEAMDLPGPAREFVPPIRPSEAGPAPKTMEERIASDPEIMRSIEGYDPELAGRVRGADSAVILDAYRQAAAAEGVRPARQMELPLGESGPGVPGRLSGPGRVVPGPTGLIPAPLRGIPGETRAMSVPGSRALSVPPDQRAAESIAVQFDRATSPLRLEHRNIDVDDALLQQAPFMRGEAPPPRPRSNNGRKLAAAAAAATGAGIIATMPGDRTAQAPATADEPAFTSGGEADLVEEARPAPKVAATEETPQPTVKQGPQDYSMQARALINRLNDMRRAAGGEVPEAKAIMAEVNRLIAMGNAQRREPTFVPGDDASSKYKQAQGLINQVNALYRQGRTPNSPDVQALMRQVRQLQSEGDAMRNRRAG